MWRFIGVFFIGGILGTAFGIVVGIFVFPYLFPPPPADETLRIDAGQKLVAEGMFIHANPKDPIHYGKGKVSVYKHNVFLHDDFEVGPGPKFHVYLVPAAIIRQSDVVSSSMFVDLGRLRAFKGSQNYRIPDGLDLEKFTSIVIWCEQFKVLISPADLSPK